MAIILRVILNIRESFLSILRWSSLRQYRDCIMSVTLEVCPLSWLTYLAALRWIDSSLNIYKLYVLKLLQLKHHYIYESMSWNELPITTATTAITAAS